MEPNPFTFHSLACNVATNGLAGTVIPLCLAAAGKTATTALVLSGAESGFVGNSLIDAKSPPPGTATGLAFGTLSFTVDDLIETVDLPFPNHIKIDVDGLEPEILSGAETTLRDSRLQTVIVEFNTHDAPNRDAIQGLMTRCGLNASAEGMSVHAIDRLYVRAG